MQESQTNQPHQLAAPKIKPRESHERQNGITIISGRQGVGKTHNLKREIQNYVSDNPQTGKTGGRVLIYDPNDEYKGVPIIGWNKIAEQPPKTIRRVLAGKVVSDPVTGRNEVKPFTLAEKQRGFLFLIENYRNGMLILEDFNSYALNTRSMNVVSVLTTARHRQIDVTIVLQEIGKVTKDLWANIAYYVFHKQMSNVDRERDKIPNFPLVKIADFAVSEQYDAATRLKHEGKISKEEAQKHCSYFVYISFRDNMIFGCSKERYMRAVKNYLKITDRGSEVKDYCLGMGLNHKKPEVFERALEEVAKKYLNHYGGVHK